MFTKAFWQATGERAIKSFSQGCLVLLGVSETGPGNLFEANIGNIVGGGATYAVISVLTSVAVGAVSGDGPSLAPAAEAEVALAPLTGGQ